MVAVAVVQLMVVMSLIVSLSEGPSALLSGSSV